VKNYLAPLLADFYMLVKVRSVYDSIDFVPQPGFVNPVAFYVKEFQQLSYQWLGSFVPEGHRGK
jgi:hypothetical protein